jgi:oxalate decarboxylase/phosphoglucose isomerase-like protein (cupin superfamily)
MKALRLAVALAVVPAVAAAQDPVKVDPGHYKVLVDNAAVRVLKVGVPPGGKSPAHAHPDSLVVPLSDGKALMTLPDGKTQENVLTKETAVYAPAGTHAPANVGAGPIDLILVEFKTAAAGKATLPPARPGLQQTVLADSPRAVAYKVTTTPEFQEAPGTTHEYDQVVISLGAAEVNLAVEGQAPVTKWQRGDVHFVPRGAKHASKNTSGKPADMILVAIR